MLTTTQLDKLDHSLIKATYFHLSIVKIRFGFTEHTLHPHTHIKYLTNA